MASELEIEAAVQAMIFEDPIPCSLFNPDEIQSLARVALEAAERVRTGWKCKVKRTAAPPQDCNWPFCGCDPAANRVRDAIEGGGPGTALVTTRPGAAT